MRVLVLLAAVALLPWASAASTLPLDGRLRFDQPPRIEGAVAFASPEGGLDLSRAVTNGEPLRLSWSSASGHLVSASWTTLRSPQGPIRADPQHQETQVALPEGSLTTLRCAPGCRVFVVGLDARADVRIAGSAHGVVAPLAEAKEYWAFSRDPNRKLAYDHVFPAGSLRAGPVDDGDASAALDDATPSATGPLGLLVVNATFEARLADGGTRTFDTRARHATPAPLVEQDDRSFLFLRLEDARLEGEPGSSGVFLAPRGTLDVDGALSSPAATGRLRTGKSLILPSASPVEIVGRVALDLAPDDADDGALAATVTGEATSVRLGTGAPQWSAKAAGIAGATGVVVLLAALVLYSRIRRSTVLESPKRRAVLDLITERPGMCPLEVARSLGISRMVVEHHVRMLAEHGLVVVQSSPAKRRLFAQGAFPQAERMRAHIALEDATRRAIAAALRGGDAPLTQRQIMERTGLSQRLVSYHLAALGEAGLVQRLGTVPRGYAPTTLLASALGETPSAT